MYLYSLKQNQTLKAHSAHTAFANHEKYQLQETQIPEVTKNSALWLQVFKGNGNWFYSVVFRTTWS